MCGIVGLFLKDPELESGLGALLAGMLGTLCDRGPDSAGFAIYGRETSGSMKLTLRASPGYDMAGLMERLSLIAGAELPHEIRDTHVVITVRAEQAAAMRAELARGAGISIVGTGRRMEIFKEVGRPDRVAQRFRLAAKAAPQGAQPAQRCRG